MGIERRDVAVWAGRNLCQSLVQALVTSGLNGIKVCLLWGSQICSLFTLRQSVSSSLSLFLSILRLFTLLSVYLYYFFSFPLTLSLFLCLYIFLSVSYCLPIYFSVSIYLTLFFFVHPSFLLYYSLSFNQTSSSFFPSPPLSSPLLLSLPLTSSLLLPSLIQWQTSVTSQCVMNQPQHTPIHCTSELHSLFGFE